MKPKETRVLKGANPPSAEGFFLPGNLLGIKELTAKHIEEVLNRASHYKKQRTLSNPKSDELKGRKVVNLFFESSTRTRTSFELAAKDLSADLTSITPQATSLTKGETLKDMAQTLDAMGADLLIVRHAASGVPGLIAQYSRGAIINAGDGSHEHPTQALVDLFTVREIHGSIQGLHLLIVGDLAYSRVARSNIYGFLKMGAKVTCVGPATLIPPGLPTLGVKVGTNLDEELPKADIVMLLRIQKERQETLNFPSLSEYTRFWGLTQDRLPLLKKETLIMHPGPINRGLEIDPQIADHRGGGNARTVILDQVTNGIAVRMAVLSLWGVQA